MYNIFTPKTPKNFSCELCDFECFKQSDYDRHISTSKHKRITSEAKKDNFFTPEKKFKCHVCNRVYSFRSGLSKHKKHCYDNKNEPINDNESIDNDENNENDEEDNNINNESNRKYDKEFIMEIMKQNQDFQKEMFLEMQGQFLEFMKNNVGNNINSNNINSHNKTFNLQVFLNEKCKDAMNIDEFVDSLKLTFNDLENVGELGFVKGISRIFINGLKELDVYKRPIHCSDLKREVIHLKADGVWEKDTENKDNMKKVVKMIANKNISKIYEWREAYPNHRYSDDPKNDIYLKLAYQSMGARSKEEDIIYYEKVIKNVAKEVTIDKNRD